MLRFDGVTCAYGAHRALHDATFDVQPGLLYGLIGPNGSGKTTTLKAAAGLIAPVRGQVLVNEQAVQALPPRQRARQVAYMPQLRETPDMSVIQLVACGRHPWQRFGRPGADDRQHIEKALHLCSLSGCAHRPLRELSGGEQQRVYLAMMLAQDAQVLLLDEPVNHLDPARQLEVFALLRTIALAGKTVLMTVHNLPLALQGCGALIVLNAGQVAAQGVPADPHISQTIQRVFGIALHQAGPGWVVTQPGD